MNWSRRRWTKENEEEEQEEEEKEQAAEVALRSVATMEANKICGNHCREFYSAEVPKVAKCCRMAL